MEGFGSKRAVYWDTMRAMALVKSCKNIDPVKPIKIFHCNIQKLNPVQLFSLLFLVTNAIKSVLDPLCVFFFFNIYIYNLYLVGWILSGLRSYGVQCGHQNHKQSQR